MAATDRVLIPQDLHSLSNEESKHCSLTKKYDAFWSDFYKTHCHGYKIKVLNKNLTGKELANLAETIKTCYENERYLPTKLAPPLLEACIFNRERENLVHVTQEMLMDFVDPEDRNTLSDNSVDDEVKLKILEKYCPEILDEDTNVSTINYIQPDQNVESDEDEDNEADVVVNRETYEKAARIIMYRKARGVILSWTSILVNLVTVEEFRFLFKDTDYNIPKNVELENDIHIYEDLLPHNKWKMFFYRWTEAQVEFYKDIISEHFGWPREPFFCFRCRSQVLTKHVLGTTNGSSCRSTLETICKERHDCILRVLEALTDEAINKNQGFFFESKPCEWKKMIMQGNMRRYKWPRELEHLRSQTAPHIIVYKMNPKKALMVEIETSWEFNFDKSPKKAKYQLLVESFKSDGFEVRFDNVQTGSRGVLRRDMYDLVREGLGMSHGRTSWAMEKISKTIVRVAYNEYNVHFEKREDIRGIAEEPFPILR